MYHHCMDLEAVIYGEIKANPKYADKVFKKAYKWLENEVGFYPLFLGVGNNKDSVVITGYNHQWAKKIGSKPVRKTKKGYYISKNILRKKGEFPNYVLFSFDNVEGVFTDYESWYIPLNHITNGNKVSDYEKRLVFKYSWKKSDWLRKARKDSGSVQLVTSKLYLPDAKRVWVRNKKTKKSLEEIGFENVRVKRLKCNSW